MDKRVAIIGCGNMGEALLKGLISKKLVSRRNIIVSDNRSARLRYIKASYKVKALSSNVKAAVASDIIILAIKPQEIETVSDEIAEVIDKKLIISTVAAITTGFLRKRTGTDRIVRIMPNICALIGYGLTVISAARGIKKSDIKTAKSICDSIGESIVLKENLMDAVTAVSGSGPAYFFLLAQALVDAAKSLGLKEDKASKMIVQTALGAALLQRASKDTPYSLCRKVASKGGTTEEALKVFRKKKFNEMVRLALNAAAQRSRQLSR